jgi:hypothetical protein
VRTQGQRVQCEYDCGVRSDPDRREGGALTLPALARDGDPCLECEIDGEALRMKRTYRDCTDRPEENLARSRPTSL